MLSVMRYERSVITVTLLQFDYLVYGLGNCDKDISTKTDLSVLTICDFLENELECVVK